MKKLLVALALFMTPVSAFAQTTKSTIISDINGLFPDNTAGAITAFDLRYVTTEIVSSYIDWLTCSTSGAIIYYSGGTPTCLLAGSSGQFLSAGTTPSWNNLASNLIAGSGIGISGTITPTVAVSDVVLNGLQPLSTQGFVALTAAGIPDTFASRTLSASTGIGITNPAGIAGNPAISLNNQIAAAGPIGSATVVPSITYNAQGQLTAVSSNTISASTLLDVISSTQGSVLYRGASGWAFLSPGVSGQIFTTGGAGANPSYTSVAGTGTLTSILCGTGLTCSTNPITVSGTITPTYTTAAQYQSATPSSVMEPGNVWASAALTSLSFASTVTPDFSTGYNFTIPVTGNLILGNPTNVKVGQTGCIYLVQGSGSSTGTVSFQGTTTWKFSGGTKPTASGASLAVDALCYQARTASFLASNYLTNLQ